MPLRSLSLPPHNNRHTHTVIFLHGWWSTAKELCDALLESHDRAGRSLQHIFPSVKWVFPEAELRYSERFNSKSHHWFDIWKEADPEEKGELQVQGLRESTSSLIRSIQSEATRVGLRNVVLAGVSQGCATAVHALLNYPAPEGPGTTEADNRLGGFVGISGWMTLAADSVQASQQALGLDLDQIRPSEDIYHNTPVFLSHSVDDTIVPIQRGRQLRDTLNQYGLEVIWKEYETGGHWIYTPQGVGDIVSFLKDQGLEAA